MTKTLKIPKTRIPAKVKLKALDKVPVPVSRPADEITRKLPVKEKPVVGAIPRTSKPLTPARWVAMSGEERVRALKEAYRRVKEQAVKQTPDAKEHKTRTQVGHARTKK